MNYKDYDIANFITDEFFIQWIKNPNENNSHFWEKWVDQHPEKRALVNEAANLIRSVKYEHSPEFTDKMYVEVFEQILKADDPKRYSKHLSASKISPPKIKRYQSHIPLRKIAFFLLISFSVWALFEAFNYRAEPVEKAEIPLVRKSTLAGQKSIIELKDGTRIRLNSESEIEYPKEFSADFRLVKLKGEAFFEVKKEQRPFLVESGSSTIQVLGTSFNVKQKANESLHVALVTGEVRIDAVNGDQVTLNPNEMLVMENDGKFSKSGFDPLEVTGWKDNYLVFKSAKFSEVKKKLESWYGVNVILKGDLDMNWTYSGVYKDEIMENVLRGICLTSGMTYSMEEKKITLTYTN